MDVPHNYTDQVFAGAQAGEVQNPNAPIFNWSSMAMEGRESRAEELEDARKRSLFKTSEKKYRKTAR